MMTTLFYLGTNPNVTMIGLAHYGELLATHSFYRVQLPTKKQDS